MNNKELVTELAKRLGKTQKEVSAMLNITTASMLKSFTENSTMLLYGFGSFEVRKKKDRAIVNPVTKQQLIVPPKLALVFKTSPVYKEKIKRNGK